ncbi:hypothetical protein HN011_010979 [Eciton burchellii]|nr:hypothetical protein HN011_010979 [Eciton burchellii]
MSAIRSSKSLLFFTRNLTQISLLPRLFGARCRRRHEHERFREQWRSDQRTDEQRVKRRASRDDAETRSMDELTRPALEMRDRELRGLDEVQSGLLLPFSEAGRLGRQCSRCQANLR